MYISEALVQKHQRRGSKQTGKFSEMLQMFPPTVSSHECWVADCSRYEGRRRQMICHLVQFLYVEPRASRYQPISCQDDECRPADSTRLDTPAHVQWGTYGSVLRVCRQSAACSQCSDRNTGVMCSDLRVPVTSRTAAFWTDCNRWSWLSAMPYSTELQ